MAKRGRPRKSPLYSTTIFRSELSCAAQVDALSDFDFPALPAARPPLQSDGAMSTPLPIAQHAPPATVSDTQQHLHPTPAPNLDPAVDHGTMPSPMIKGGATRINLLLKSNQQGTGVSQVTDFTPLQTLQTLAGIVNVGAAVHKVASPLIVSAGIGNELVVSPLMDSVTVATAETLVETLNAFVSSASQTILVSDIDTNSACKVTENHYAPL